jgi:hypothetical protein
VLARSRPRLHLQARQARRVLIARSETDTDTGTGSRQRSSESTRARSELMALEHVAQSEQHAGKVRLLEIVLEI